MNDVGPLQMWRAIFALALTAMLCLGTYLLITYLTTPP
jgi:hypothetical protein